MIVMSNKSNILKGIRDVMRRRHYSIRADHWGNDRNSSDCCQTVVRFRVAHHRVPEAEGA